jgi:dTDP-4-dehydrorhamnose 3,5-epimerase
MESGTISSKITTHDRGISVLRGLHYQITHRQAQLVKMICARIFDVAVDLRSNSASFGRWCGVELSDNGPRQLYMVPGFAHGFCVLSEFADLHYKVSRFYDREDEGGLIWNDRDVGIRWPIANPVVSPRDEAHRSLQQLDRANLPHIGPPS